MTELAELVAGFSAVCDALFAGNVLPPAMRDRRFVLAEQLTRLEATTEDLHVSVGDDPAATRAARVGLVDVRLAIDQLAR